MLEQDVQTRTAVDSGVTTTTRAPSRRKHRTIENGKAVWSLWATVHWLVFATITLSVLYVVVLLQ